MSGGFAFDSKGNVFPLVTCSTNQGCTATQLPLSSTPGGLDLVLYGTGQPEMRNGRRGRKVAVAATDNEEGRC